jgi:hypothetical protein
LAFRDDEDDVRISSIIEWDGRILAVGSLGTTPVGLDRAAVWIGEWSD